MNKHGEFCVALSTVEMLFTRQLSKIKQKDSLVTELFSFTIVMHLSAAIPGGGGGGDPGDIRGNSAGFAGFYCQCLARDGGIGPLLHVRGKIHGERAVRFVTSPPS